MAAAANARLNTLLKGRRCFSDVAVRLYKSQVLCVFEYATPAIFHAPPFFLRRLDNIQNRFLEALDILPAQALEQYNLCPLSARDIAMLGLIHRTVLGKGPQHFPRFFKPVVKSTFLRVLRHPESRHCSQLHDAIHGAECNALKRSVISLIYPYNLLPARTVALQSVSSFQKALQRAVKAESASH
eukprot:TRINITY_DN36168_c0_g1_i1.p1 TRINITY_DN36168_c0_g1~~TRINITY_DN36168_c0_g1_i1.p1  ORF type:complete len:194 (-),score=20.76 TRINITY_DN36168_c0_g1_i1:48-602(-)